MMLLRKMMSPTTMRTVTISPKYCDDNSKEYDDLIELTNEQLVRRLKTSGSHINSVALSTIGWTVFVPMLTILQSFRCSYDPSPLQFDPSIIPCPISSAVHENRKLFLRIFNNIIELNNCHYFLFLHFCQ